MDISSSFSLVKHRKQIFYDVRVIWIDGWEERKKANSGYLTLAWVILFLTVNHGHINET